MWAYSVLPSKNSQSEIISTSLPMGFQDVFGYHASMSSNLHVQGISITIHLLSSCSHW